ncbi:pentatricopeptide repeat-containing protein [Tanacetum coccineum]
MINSGVKPNSTTIPSVILACANLSSERHGKEIHGYCIKVEELDSNLVVNNSFIDFYSKCQNLGYDARKHFNRIIQKDVVSWNSILAACAIKGSRNDALKFFNDMELQGVFPDIITWNGLITGFTQFGDGNTALEFFAKMCKLSISPNTTTISGVLAACAQTKNLRLGKEIHNYAIRNEVEMGTGVGSALIAMYSGCDDREASYAIFDGLPTKDDVNLEFNYCY